MNAARRDRQDDWLVYVAGPPAGRSAPMGGFFDKVGDFFKDVGHSIEKAARSIRDSVKNVLRTAARSAAVEIGFRVAGTIVTAGLAAPIIQLGVSAAGRFGAGQALDQALNEVSGTVSGSTTSSVTGTAGGITAWTQDNAGLIIEVARTYGPILAPEQTNKVLQEVAKFANQVDAFGTLYTMAFTELTIQAEESKKRRDDLRLRIARIKADVARRGGVWLIVAKHAYQAIQATVIAIGTAGAGLPIIAGITALDMAQFAVSAAQMALELVNATELARISKEKLEDQRKAHESASEAEARRLEEEIARLRREIEELGGLAHDGAPVTRADLDPAIVAVLGPEGGRLPLVATIEWALTLGAPLVPPAPPPALEEVIARTRPPPEPKTTTTIRHVFHWVPGLRR